MTITCAACGLPNEAGAHRCHACGAALVEPTGADADVLVELEAQLATARNRLADLDWRVGGVGWLSIGLLLTFALVAGPNVGHPTFGSAIDCGTPLEALRGAYGERYASTVWLGCEEAARPWLVVASGAVLCLLVGGARLAWRGLRVRAACADVVRSQQQVHEARTREGATP